MNTRKSWLIAIALLAFTTSTSVAQNTPNREGFWLNIGLGAGSLGCSDCEARETGLSGGLAFGGTLNQHWLLGVFSNGWSKSEEGVTLTAGTLVAGVRYYPSATGGFFLNGGIGVGAVDVAVSGFGGARETGSGAFLGLGYDIPLGTAISLTPFWNGAAVAFSGGDANFGQIGIGITIH
jgi:hypothetical protein